MKYLALLLLCFSLHAAEDPFTPEKFLQVQKSLDGFLIKTPLIELPQTSEKAGKRVFLKDEARQKGYSFKTRGVTYEVFATIEQLIKEKPEMLKKGVKLVTQTDGNHGVALILAIKAAIEKYAKQYPSQAIAIRKIEPVIFTYKKVLPVKRETMDSAMKEYRTVGFSKGAIYDTYEDYGDARKGRERYITASNGQAIYMEHGAIKTMLGHATATLEILDQLKVAGVAKDKKICILLPIGAGGPIGLAACLKAFRPDCTAVMVQTPRWGAFITSFRTGQMAQNDSSLSPYTVEIDDEGVKTKVVYEDGISVDAPESMEAIAMSRKYLNDAILADPMRALKTSAPLLLSDIDRYYKNPDLSIIGGTTAILADAYFANLGSEALRQADVIVLFGTEGSIHPAIKNYTRKLLASKS